MHVDARRAQAGREDRDQRGTRRAHEHRNPCGGDEPDLLAALSTRGEHIAIRQGQDSEESCPLRCAVACVGLYDESPCAKGDKKCKVGTTRTGTTA